MREEIANLVHPVFTYGLRLKDRLERGESLEFASEQAALKGLLLGELEAKRYPEFGGQSQDGATMARMSMGGRRSPDVFLGIRYALACWLDEIFILDSPWERMWNERKLEEALYGTNDRAWFFWEQAQLAANRTGVDALEAFYLCVMLGFRGDYREKPDKLKTWVEASGKRIGREQGKEWSCPPELEPPMNVPPLHGRERLQRMVLIVAVFVFVLVPIVVFLLMSKILQ